MKKALNPKKEGTVLIKKKTKPNDSYKKAATSKKSYLICFLNLTDQPKSFCYCKQRIAKNGHSWEKKTFKNIPAQSIARHTIGEEMIFFNGVDCNAEDIHLSGIPTHNKKNWVIIAEKEKRLVAPGIIGKTVIELAKKHTCADVKKIIKENLGKGDPKKLIKNW